MAQITRSMRIGRAPVFKLISLKEHQIWENQFHELNTYIDLNSYIGRLFTDIYWNLWKGEYSIAELYFDKINEEFIKASKPNTKIPNKCDFKILLQYEAEEKKVINDEILKMNKLIKDIIDNKVIPELSKIIAKPIS